MIIIFMGMVICNKQSYRKQQNPHSQQEQINCIIILHRQRMFEERHNQYHQNNLTQG